MNVAALTADNRLIYPVGAPFEAFMMLKGHEEPMALAGALRQVHGTTLWDADCLSPNEHPEGDGLFIKARNGSGGQWHMRYADCAPVVLWCPGGDGWLMVLHSGFSGTVSNIAAAAVTFALAKSHESKMEMVQAWIGPNIGPCCYDRRIAGDAGTREALRVFTPEACFRRGDRVYFDLALQIARQLVKAGLSSDNITCWKECTCCRNDRYYSYRGGDHTSRMTLVARRLDRELIPVLYEPF